MALPQCPEIPPWALSITLQQKTMSCSRRRSMWQWHWAKCYFAKIWKRCRNEFPGRPERQRIHLAFERLKEDNQFSEYQNEEWKVTSLQCTSTSLGWNKGVLLFNLASKSVTWITCLQLKPETLKLWVKYNFPSLEWLITEAHCEWKQPNLHSWMSVSVLVAFRSTCECSRALSSNSG